MMTGVTILNTIEVVITGNIALGLIVGGFVGCALFGILLIVSSYNDNLFFTWLSGICCLISACCIVAGGFSSPKFHHYEYEVLIDEEVNLVDFYEKYDIIEKKGEIYVIKEKEEENNRNE